MVSPDNPPNVKFYGPATRFLEDKPLEVVTEILSTAAQLWYDHDVDGELIFLVPTPPGFHRVYIGEFCWILFRLEGIPRELKVIDVGLVCQDDPPKHENAGRGG